jgi:hypothetical protein
VLLDRVDLLDLEEVSDEVAVGEVRLFHQHDLLVFDESDDAREGSAAPEELDGEDMAALEGEEPLDLEVLPQHWLTYDLLGLLVNLDHEGGDEAHDIKNADFGSPLGADVLEVVMEGIDSELNGILIQKVERGLFGGVAVLQDNFEFQLVEEGQSLKFLDLLLGDLNHHHELRILARDVPDLESQLGLGVLERFHF